MPSSAPALIGFPAVQVGSAASNSVSEEENGSVEVKSVESANTDVEVQKEKE